MIFVISPAKTLDYETAPSTQQYSQPDFLADSGELIDQLKSFLHQKFHH